MKTILYIIASFLVVAGGLWYVYSQRSVIRPLLQNLPVVKNNSARNFSPLQPAIVNPEKKSPLYSVTRVELSQESLVLNTLRGKIVSEPTYQGDILTLQIVIDGDGSKTPLLFVLTAKNGQMKYAEQKVGVLTWKLTPTETIKDSLKSGDAIEARFLSESGSKNNFAMNDTGLDALINGEPISPSLVLAPTMIAKL